MTKLASVFAVIGLLVATTRTAIAAPVINTPPLPSNIGGAVALICQALNTGSKTATVTVEIIDANGGGATLATNGPSPLSPHTLMNASVITVTSNTYCRVTGLTPPKGRVTYFAEGAGGSILMSVTAP